MAMKDITDLQVVRAVQRRQDDRDGPWPYETLSRETGQPEKVCYRAMERADSRGYLEYGVSLRTAWLTDKGKALLASNAELSGVVSEAQRNAHPLQRFVGWLPHIHWWYYSNDSWCKLRTCRCGLRQLHDGKSWVADWHWREDELLKNGETAHKCSCGRHFMGLATRKQCRACAAALRARTKGTKRWKHKT